MILLDKPYISTFLKDTILKNSYPTLALSPKDELNIDDRVNLISREEASAIVNGSNYPKFYTNSENSIDWIENNLKNTKLPDIIDLFKNKPRFRRFLSDLYPDYYFEEIRLNELMNVDSSRLPFPIILKPAVGFFSVGVYKINSPKEWNEVVAKIEKEVSDVNKMYPSSVLNTNTFIIEEYVEGDEYAFDAYYNENGEPVILNIFKHFFSSSDDVGDRVYLSSAEVINDKLESFTKFLNDIGHSTDLKNFPLHVEVRITEENKLFPIEVNPMRFGGWCTTADSTFYSYRFNPIVYFFNQQKPNWEEILKGKEDKLYSLIVLDNSTGYHKSQIKSFDYDKVLRNFENVLEFRKMNIAEYNVFGFIFCETSKDNFAEIERILKSDLKEFVTV